MNVEAVMNEIGSKLDTIAGLTVFPYTTAKVTPPGAVVGLPEDITFDVTYGRGSDRITLPVWLLVAQSSGRAARTALTAYLNGSGPHSVKAAVDSSPANTYISCDEVTVTTATTGTYTSGGVEMLGAEFTVDIAGRGQVT